MNDLEQHTDILSLIRVRMSGLSKGHKRIAEYILANYENVHSLLRQSWEKLLE
ncbi:MAG: hypothetical protein ACLS9K_08610 [Lachnospira eligens]